MILVTVGMQLGFDRLIAAMDTLAPQLGTPVIAQTGAGNLQPVNMEAHPSLQPDEFQDLMERCKLVVSHAGIGTVLNAQRIGRPIILMPRRANLGEHRSDHQMATCAQLENRSGIFVAWEVGQLGEKITQAMAYVGAVPAHSTSADDLRASVARFIETGCL